ncbi:MAG: hypothetical protein AAGB46_10555 [Verrucomicrobiota bacterium]
MNINDSNNANHIYAQNLANSAKAKPGQGTDAGAKPSFDDKLDLAALDKLRAEPEIRPEVVAKGKELANDPNWPPKEMIDSIAKLIVPFADDE